MESEDRFLCFHFSTDIVRCRWTVNVSFSSRGGEKKLQALKRMKSTLSLQHIPQPSSLQRFKGESACDEDEWSCTTASSPPTSAYSLPTPPLPSESAVVMSLIFCILSPLSTNSSTQCECEDLANSSSTIKESWITLQTIERVKEQKGRSLLLKDAAEHDWLGLPHRSRI